MLSGMFGISPSATESINAPAITPASPAAKPIVATNTVVTAPNVHLSNFKLKVSVCAL